MLQDVVRMGTAARAMQLGRTDLAGKTGTTNDFVDAWFCGFSPALVAVAWIGFDNPQTLGRNETGRPGGAADVDGVYGQGAEGRRRSSRVPLPRASSRRASIPKADCAIAATAGITDISTRNSCRASTTLRAAPVERAGRRAEAAGENVKSQSVLTSYGA